jgi:hypothetical protein
MHDNRLSVSLTFIRRVSAQREFVTRILQQAVLLAEETQSSHRNGAVRLLQSK